LYYVSVDTVNDFKGVKSALDLSGIGVKSRMVNKGCFLAISATLPNFAASLDWLGRAALPNRATPMPLGLAKAVLPTASP